MKRVFNNERRRASGFHDDGDECAYPSFNRSCCCKRSKLAHPQALHELLLPAKPPAASVKVQCLCVVVRWTGTYTSSLNKNKRRLRRKRLAALDCVTAEHASVQQQRQSVSQQQPVVHAACNDARACACQCYQINDAKKLLMSACMHGQTSSSNCAKQRPAKCTSCVCVCACYACLCCV